ncbi:hypothetical protein Ppa06_28240 [Planomonospora parontospora subsp. parontospora]|uniref:Uncharacterized protein n=2 Tax=Planomonospora parontospora TaxID=58119 RepID=A0AA37F4S4_9ACTN|nr:hypothetical protein [Planomonospora parontospora]GGK68525.1 hypothetical protein GCM10010126_29920 [Planomonospora parontospora]GII09026.1 hypothetical protein Ppa06_28240 [Planomonospora parontospora subsp. parontospora]
MAEIGGRRGVVFAVLVGLLAAVGIYLTMWESGTGGEQTQVGPVGVSRTGTEPGAGRQVDAESPRPAATASDAPFDVYSYLPMTKQELAAAADYAERFTADYGTYAHDEDPAAYGDRLRGYATTEFAEVLVRARTSPGFVEANRADEVVSTASAKVRQIRQVQDSSVVFVVACTERITAKSGEKERVDEYAVTLVPVGADWRVHDLQPADEGQEGDERPSGTGG